MPSTHSPLRYPGGKTALAPFLKAVIKVNRLTNPIYIEPYCGGAGAAFELLFQEVVSEIRLNDIDPAIYSFWQAVLQRPDDLCDFIESTRVSVAEWRRHRLYYRAQRRRIGFKLGLSAFFLNRVNRSGILAGNPIGGLAQDGKWKIDARFNREALIQKIQRISRFRTRIRLSNMDAIAFLKGQTSTRDTLVYLDPPYYAQGKSLYENHYVGDDHVEIANYVRGSLHLPWVVSYDAHPEIKKLYAGLPRVDYGIRYSAHEHYFGRELIVLSPDLHLPTTPDPLAVGRRKQQQDLRRSDKALAARVRHARR